MKTAMISGHFDPFTYAHLDYIKGASKLGDSLVCVVSNNKQAEMKKGRVNEPVEDRAEILDLIMRGLDIEHQVYVNTLDKRTTYVSEMIAHIHPDIFCRGSDKSIEDMPPDEKKVCEELGIEIIHVKGKIIHGSDFI